MEEYTCDTCINAIYAKDYEFTHREDKCDGSGNFNYIREIIPSIICCCKEAKDGWYNRFERNKKLRVDARDEPDILIGNANEYCRGMYYEYSGISVLDVRRE